MASRIIARAALLALAVAAFSGAAQAADPSAGAGASYDQIVNRAVEYLRAKGQAADGSYTKQSGPAVTSIVVTGVLRNGRSADDPAVAKSLKYLETFVRDDGGIYAEGSNHQNYETAVALQAFVEANRDKRYEKIVKNAEKYLKGLQWDESEELKKSDTDYGGAGYGRSKRPDLSNTSFFLDALKAAGNGADDESVKKALVFVSRCQNLETANNTTPFPAKNPDGGFYYTPSSGGTSQAGNTPDGGLRSYGSMTYAGLKSMIFAGVGPDDPRVKAAVKWLSEHYDLDSNPGMEQAGLFYYYQVFAKALHTLGQDKFADAAGKQHDWRAELIAALASRQKENGSWINDNARWMEGDANLVTGYALLALSYCRPK